MRTRKEKLRSDMDVLLIGGGGREHALAWKIAQSPRVGKMYIAPGNAGTALVGENVPLEVLDFGGLADFAEEKKVALTVVGPDDPLALGIVDFFEARKLRIWGPSKAAAQLESSKAFAKQLMHDARIPTAEFKVFREHGQALDYVHTKGAPIVIKASGLALGKGAYVCMTMEEAEVALDEIMVQKLHKAAGDEVVVEEFLDGQEISIHALCDGINYVIFPSSQDHKRALDGDAGKNTGGMGAIAPLPWFTQEMMQEIERTIIRPTLSALASKGTPFKGLLYPGLKMTNSGPKVLEFNARFGDPEAQVYMRLLDTDLLEALEACIDGTLGNIEMRWHIGSAVNIVLASGGYPDAYKKGLPITGIEEAKKVEGVIVFHAGTSGAEGAYKTNGGRVLGVSAMGSPLQNALDIAYAAAEKIQFEGKYYRRDIGAKSI